MMYHSLRFSQYIVSSDNQLLVCCIANTILIYRRNASNVNSSKRVLHGHLGRVEFCRFLKENRYLISYGIDGMVFLWDIIECKAVGFTKIPLDTVACMAVSPDGKKIVCYSSTNLMCLVKLSVQTGKPSPLAYTPWWIGSGPSYRNVVDSCSTNRNQHRPAFTYAIIQDP